VSQCHLDHSTEDVKKKFESQMDYLPSNLTELFSLFFEKTHTQQTLNEVFHLLKKYDLSSEEERVKRNGMLLKYLQ
jgi:hypothetical protein